jgi:methionine-gamma-lyase
MLGGAVIGSRQLIKPVRSVGLRYMTGATLSPFNAFLAIRGIKTLGLRMRQHSEAANKLSQALLNHTAVENVYYPTAHPDLEQRRLVERYMPSGCGGVLSFTLRCTLAEVKLFVDSLTLVKLAVSLGTCETLIEHPYSMTHSAYLDHKLLTIPDNLLRISMGLEDENDIIEDVVSGLDRLKGYSS